MRDPDNTLLRKDWSPDLLSRANIDAVQTEYEVLHLMRQCASHFQFSHFLVARYPGYEQQSFAERLLVSNWPPELVRKYDATGLFPMSRLVAETAATKLPVHGDSALLAPAGEPGRDGSRDAAETIALAEGSGLAFVTAFQLHSAAGDPYLMAFSGRRGALSRPETAELYFTAVQLLECLERTFGSPSAGRERLSSREVECLRWAAAGKSSDEIAIILGISVYTVSSYFKTATKKLQAVNRMQAIACALRLKLI